MGERRTGTYRDGQPASAWVAARPDFSPRISPRSRTEGSRQPTRENKYALEAKLGKLYEEQQREDDTDPCVAFTLPAGQPLLESYFQGPSFARIQEQTGRNGRGSHNSSSRLRGAAFADLAKTVLGAELAESFSLLSGRRTLAFYRELFPHAPQINDPYEQSSLAGISVPDGLVVAKNRSGDYAITNIVEYKSFFEREKIEKQYRAYMLHRKTFPHLFLRDAKILVFTPQLTLGQLQSVGHLRDAVVRELPFTSNDYQRTIKEANRNGIASYTSTTDFYSSVAD